MKRTLRVLMASAVAAASFLTVAAVAEAADRTCRSSIKSVTISGNVVVPDGATCSLTNVTVQGDVKVGRGSTLTATRSTITGNVQGESAPAAVTISRTQVNGDVQTKGATGRVYLYYAVVGGDAQAESGRYEQRVVSSTITGNVQTKYMHSLVEYTKVGGNIQHEEGRTSRIVRNQVGGDVQVLKNRFKQVVSYNNVKGNLQCKENTPAPVGGLNVVAGAKEDQCRRL